MMAATTVFLAGASVAGGWAVYERWWRSCVAEDPLAASCIEAQDHAFLYDLFQRFDGLPPLIVAYGLQYGLAAVAFLLLPFAVGASRGMRAVGVGVAACYGLLATEALLSPAAADPFFGQAPYDLVVVWVLVMLFAFIAPLPAVLALFTAFGLALARLIWTADPWRILGFASALTISEWLRSGRPGLRQ